MNNAIELLKQAQNKGAGDEADSIYSSAFQEFEVMSKQTEGNSEGLWINWGIGLANQSLTKKDPKEAAELYNQANSKYEKALSVATDNKHLVYYNWGNMILDRGIQLKKEGSKETDNILAEARNKFTRAIDFKPDYVDAINNLKRALREQMEMADGNTKFWYSSQIAEKDRWLAEIASGTAPSSRNTETSDDKVTKAVQQKEMGNEFFKASDYSKAMLHWHTALNYINGLYGLNAEQDRKMKELKLSVLNNMATVHIKQGKHEKAIEGLNKVLEVDSKNIKALFKRGKSYLARGEVDKARADLMKARDYAPDDKEILRELQLLDKKEQEQTAKQKSFYKNMFQQ